MEGPRTPRADLLPLLAAPLSAEIGSSSRGGCGGSQLPQLLRGRAGGERASPAPPVSQPAPRALLRRCPGLAAQHGFPPGAGDRVLALPAGCCGVRREVSGPPGLPLPAPSHANFTPALGSSLSVLRQVGPPHTLGGSRAVEPPFYQWRCPRPGGRAPCASGNQPRSCELPTPGLGMRAAEKGRLESGIWALRALVSRSRGGDMRGIPRPGNSLLI